MSLALEEWKQICDSGHIEVVYEVKSSTALGKGRNTEGDLTKHFGNVGSVDPDIVYSQDRK